MITPLSVLVSFPLLIWNWTSFPVDRPAPFAIINTGTTPPLLIAQEDKPKETREQKEARLRKQRYIRYLIIGSTGLILGMGTVFLFSRKPSSGKGQVTASPQTPLSPEPSTPHTPPQNATVILDNSPSPDQTSFNQTTRLAKADLVVELIHDLTIVDAGKRRKAIWELAQRGDSRAIQPLVELMIDVDSQQRSLILEAISQIATRTLKPVGRAFTLSLQDESADVRKNAIRDLTRTYEVITQINQRLAMVVDDPDDEVRETAQWAIKQLNQLPVNINVEFPIHHTSLREEP